MTQAVIAACFRQYLIRLARAKSKFSSFGYDRVVETAELPFRYAITSPDSWRATGETSREFPSVDLRRGGNLPFARPGFLRNLARHIPPKDRKGSEKNLRCAELDIPR